MQQTQSVCISLADNRAEYQEFVAKYSCMLPRLKMSAPPTHCTLQGTPNMVISLVGNKADLESARQVTQDEAKSYAEENSLFFWETSAKSNSNVSELFQDMAKRLPKAASTAPAQVPQDCIWPKLLSHSACGSLQQHLPVPPVPIPLQSTLALQAGSSRWLSFTAPMEVVWVHKELGSRTLH